MKYTSETMLLKSTDKGGTGSFAEVRAESAGWEYLNMSAMRLNKGGTYSDNTRDNENAIVILSGRCTIRTSDGDFENIGRRPSVFSGMPYALYLSRNKDFEIIALTDGFEFASCWVPTDEDHPTQLVTPDMSPVEIRGGANATRQINGILPPGFDCHRIVCVEVYTPSGNWSSYPPHKHDVHREDEKGNLLEADLEEIYFYKIDNPGGYAYQRVYNDDRSIDGLMMAQHHDAVLVPEGYHPVVSAHGYTTYYLNFLAGSAQSLANSDDPAYAWVKDTWTYKDPRLPIVHHGMEPLGTRVALQEREPQTKKDFAHRRLARVLQPLADEKRNFIDDLKSRAIEYEEPDFIWRAMIASFSTWGNSSGYDRVMGENGVYNRITYRKLSEMSADDRCKTITQAMEDAGIRMWENKASYLCDNFDVILSLGGIEAAKQTLESHIGAEGKIKFLKQFKGIGDKYSRNMMMDVYHPDFHNTIAIDNRIENITQAVGLSPTDFDGYEDQEHFYLELTEVLGINGWELDRLLYNFETEIIEKLQK